MALGRVFWAAVSDFLGRARVYFLLYLIQVAVFFSLPHLRTATLFTAAVAVIGLCYGGGFGTMPSFTADFFGAEVHGRNLRLDTAGLGSGRYSVAYSDRPCPADDRTVSDCDSRHRDRHGVLADLADHCPASPARTLGQDADAREAGGMKGTTNCPPPETGVPIQRYGAPVLAVCGYSGSGKTTLLEAALPHLRARGLSVAVVKHAAHGFVVDKAGKDSDRLFRAGATVALRGPSEQFHRRGAEAMLTLETTLADLGRDHDLLLVEGHKDTPLPKLWLGNAETAAPPKDVREVEALLPWNADRLGAFLAFLGKWLPEAWAARPLLAGLLVGGRSSRMGRPKQLLNFRGRPLGWIVAQALRGALSKRAGPTDAAGANFARVVALGSGVLPDLLAGLQRLPDPPDIAGPMAGLLAGHRWAPSAAWMVAACDHPWLTAEDLRWLAAQRRPGAWAIIPRQPDGHPCPTLALYEPQALTTLERLALALPRLDMRLAALCEHPRTLLIDPPPQSGRGWINVNTPEEFSAEEARANDEPVFRAA